MQPDSFHDRKHIILIWPSKVNCYLPAPSHSLHLFPCMSPIHTSSLIVHTVAISCMEKDKVMTGLVHQCMGGLTFYQSPLYGLCWLINVVSIHHRTSLHQFHTADCWKWPCCDLQGHWRSNLPEPLSSLELTYYLLILLTMTWAYYAGCYQDMLLFHGLIIDQSAFVSSVC